MSKNEREELIKRLQKYAKGEIDNIEQLKRDFLEPYDRKDTEKEQYKFNAAEYCLAHPEIFKESYKDFVLKLLDTHTSYYMSLPDEFRKDKDITYKAVLTNGYYLKDAPDEFKSDKKLILKSLEKNAAAIEFISPALLKDEEFLLEAVKINEYVPDHLPYNEFRRNKDFMLKAIKANNNAIHCNISYFIDDKNFMLEAIKCNAEAVNQVYEKLNTYGFMLEAVKVNPEAIRYVDCEYTNSDNFLLDVVKTNPEAFNYMYDHEKKRVLQNAEIFKMIKITKDDIKYDVKEIKANLASVKKKENNSKR